MLKLSDLVQVCRDVAHFCSDHTRSIFREFTNSVLGNVAEGSKNDVVPKAHNPSLGYSPG